MGRKKRLENSRIGTSQKKEVDDIEDVFFPFVNLKMWFFRFHVDFAGCS